MELKGTYENEITGISITFGEEFPTDNHTIKNFDGYLTINLKGDKSTEKISGTIITTPTNNLSNNIDIKFKTPVNKKRKVSGYSNFSCPINVDINKVTRIDMKLEINENTETVNEDMVMVRRQ